MIRRLPAAAKVDLSVAERSAGRSDIAGSGTVVLALSWRRAKARPRASGEGEATHDTPRRISRSYLRMMAAPDPATQERLYRAITYDLGTGRLRPGERLEALRLAKLHGSSITPVREALYRLVGERRVDLHAGGGFSVPVLGREAVSALYDCNRRLLGACLRPGRPFPDNETVQPRESHGGAGADYPDRAAGFFIGIAERSGNGACITLVRHMNGQLSALRRAETFALGDPGNELAILEDLARAPAHGTLSRALQAYHKRRMKAAALICAALLE